MGINWNKKWNLFKEGKDISISAGIVPISKDKKVLLGMRSNKVPKHKLKLGVLGGHLNEDETLEEGAVREFKEETGYEGRISNLTPYNNDDNYFMFFATVSPNIKFDPAEEFADENLWIEWFSVNDLKQRKDLHKKLEKVVNDPSFEEEISKFTEKVHERET